MRYALNLVFASAFTFCGCEDRTVSQQTTPGVYIEPKSISIYDLKPSDVIIRVNGREITRGDFDAMQAMYDAVVRMKWNLPLTGQSERASRFVKNREQKTPEELFRRELLRQEAERLGLTVDECDRSNALARVKRNLRRLKAESAESLADEIGGDAGRMFLKCFESDLRDEALRRFTATNWAYAVSDADITQRMKEVEAFNARAAASNDLQRARALKIRERALAGEDFAMLARECAQVDPSGGSEWQTVDINEVAPEEELRQWLDTQPGEGDISSPINLDDGLAIVKVARRKKIPADEYFDETTEYTLLRITLFAYEFLEAEDEENTRQTLEKEHREKAQKELFNRLYSAAVVEFPNGSDLFKNTHRGKSAIQAKQRQ